MINATTRPAYARARYWTFPDLERQAVYLLYFDTQLMRWQVQQAGSAKPFEPRRGLVDARERERGAPSREEVVEARSVEPPPPGPGSAPAPRHRAVT
jgi:hypothetical protein